MTSDSRKRRNNGTYLAMSNVQKVVIICSALYRSMLSVVDVTNKFHNLATIKRNNSICFVPPSHMICYVQLESFD